MKIRSGVIRGRNVGFTLIEVLVTMVVLAIGLLGLALLQATSLNNQLEAYHRAQAILLLEEMSNRIRVNSDDAIDGVYADAANYGQRNLDDFGLDAGEDCLDIINNAPQRDLCEWNFALEGAAVKLGDTNMGSVNGAIGCIENVAGSVYEEKIVRLTIAWQGMAKTAAPTSICGQGAFGDDEFRRVSSVDTVIARLD
jgi:type IV pilus assembly protein PilV